MSMQGYVDFWENLSYAKFQCYLNMSFLEMKKKCLCKKVILAYGEITGEC